MLLPYFRTRAFACLLLTIPVVAVVVLAWAQDRPRGKEPTVNTLGMKFALIPAGKFTMGSPETEQGRHTNEPQHEVEIKEPFYLGIHEVRVRDFRAFADDAGYKSDDEKAGNKDTWKNAIESQTEDHPVVRVSWNDAQAFCAWLRKKEGKTYRLPTEAEWEYACRAGTTTRFHNGDELDRLREVATVGHYTTTAVGEHKANAFGLFDMHGNVYEWCQDLYEQGGTDRVIRGGGWDWCDTPMNCRSAFRGAQEPSRRLAYLGFRVAREADDGKQDR